MRIRPLLAAFVTLGLSAPAAAQVTVSPIVSERSVETITIANGSASALRLDATVADFEQYGDGSHRILAPGQSPHSCGSRLHILSPPTHVGPSREERVAVRVDPGAEACWSALLLRVSDGIGRGGTFVVKLYGIPAGIPRQAEVTGLTVTPVEMRLEVRNSGSVPVRPRGRLEIRTLAGDVVGVQQIPEFGVHPGVNRALALPLSLALNPGRYVALAVLDIGTSDLVAGQTELIVGGAARGR